MNARPVRRLLLLGILLLTAGLAACTSVAPRVAPPPLQPGAFSHAELDAFLRRHVDEHGRVDYAAAADDRADLDRYLARLAAVSPDSHPERFPGDSHRLAYWINAYNASAIALVLEHYPIDSVEEVRPPLALFFLPRLSGFFVLQRVTLGGESIDLYRLENGVVRERFPEPRIHFALNCASAGCPRLPARAFSGEGLEAELEREARRFVAEERNVRLDPTGRVLRLSPIFDWYASDYTDWLEARHPEGPATLRHYVARYLPEAPARAVLACDDCRVEFVPYDWALNDRPRREAAGGSAGEASSVAGGAAPDSRKHRLATAADSGPD